MSNIALRCKAIVEQDRNLVPVLERTSKSKSRIEKLEDALYHAREAIVDLRYQVKDLSEYRRQSYDYYNYNV